MRAPRTRKMLATMFFLQLRATLVRVAAGALAYHACVCVCDLNTSLFCRRRRRCGISLQADRYYNVSALQ